MNALVRSTGSLGAGSAVRTFPASAGCGGASGGGAFSFTRGRSGSGSFSGSGGGGVGVLLFDEIDLVLGEAIRDQLTNATLEGVEIVEEGRGRRACCHSDVEEERGEDGDRDGQARARREHARQRIAAPARREGA